MKSPLRLNSFFDRFLEKIKSNPQGYLYFPLGAYWIFLFTATSIPTIPMPRMFDAQDKLEHLAAYFIFGVLLALSLAIQNHIYAIKRNFVLSSFLIVLIYAGIDELHQLLIPGRYCDFFDWIADVIGGVIGILIIKYLLKKD
ncbi:MAG: VanZ family protein [Melioribacteraceae bacterium]|nr:VanZ family protein [Melioribacteraceae bacterium]